MGDNRNDSEDSRYWGFVPQADVVGRPLLVYLTVGAQPVGASWRQRLAAMLSNARLVR